MTDTAFDLLPDPAIIVSKNEVIRINRSAEMLLGHDAQKLMAMGLDDLVEDLETVRDRWRVISETRQALRVWVRTAEGRVALDVRVGSLGEGRFVVTGRDTGDTDRLESVVGRLSGMYADANQASIADTATILGESEELFTALGWGVSVHRIDGDTAELEYLLMQDVGAGSEFSRSVIGRRFPLDALPNVRRVVESREGHFVSDAATMGGAFAKRAGSDEATVRDALDREGVRQGAFAPVITRGEVSRVLLVLGPRFSQRDVAAVQWLAGILSAADQVSKLSKAAAHSQRHAALGLMASQLAHEVRNPLAVILQAARQVRRRVQAEDDTSALLSMIDEEAMRLGRLVDDLVGFAGPLQLRPQPVNVSQIVEWSLEGCRRAAQRAVDVRLNIGADLTVQGDPRSLQSAFAHLLRNAYDHGCSHIEVSAVAQDDMAEIVVDNDGPSLPANVQQRLFEPFFTTRASGSGLGLAVARRMIEEQGGAVSLTGLGDPIRFSIRLPLAVG